MPCELMAKLKLTPDSSKSVTNGLPSAFFGTYCAILVDIAVSSGMEISKYLSEKVKIFALT